MDGLKLVLGVGLRLLLAVSVLTVSSPTHAQPRTEVDRPLVPQAAEPVTGIPPTPQTPEAWRTAAKQDLEAIQYALNTHTMIMFDEANPAYRRWQAEGYRIATERTKEVDGPNSYFDLLTSYVEGFRDPHFFLTSSIERPVRWPGFMVSWVNNKAVVTFRDATESSLPPVGSVMSACDGDAIEALVTKRVFPMTHDSRTVLGQRLAVSRLLLDFKGGLIPAAVACDFQHGDRRWSEVLSWRSIPKPSEDFWSHVVVASAGAPAQFGLSFPIEGVAWIGLPTFMQNPNTKPQIESLLSQIEAKAAEIRNGRAIVIDLRGNRGGDLGMPRVVGQAIFTWPAIAKMVQRGYGSSTDWRASPDNLAYIRTLEFNPRMRGIANRLALALTRSEGYWREGRQKADETSGLTQQRPAASRRRPFPAQVYILSDGNCVSACLAFMDMALQVPGTRLIGADTGGDTGYTSVRAQTLPSRLAEISFPIAYVHNRGRGPMEIYKADVAYTSVRDDESLRRWTLDLVMSEIEAQTKDTSG